MPNVLLLFFTLSASLLCVAGPWYRTVSCIGYVRDLVPESFAKVEFPQSTASATPGPSSAARGDKKPVAPVETLTAAITELVSTGVLLVLPTELSASTVPAIMQALDSCFRVPELRTLLSKLQGKLSSSAVGAKDAHKLGKGVSSMTRPDLLRALRGLLHQQRRLDGGRVQAIAHMTAVLTEIDGAALNVAVPPFGISSPACPTVVRVNADVVVSRLFLCLVLVISFN